MTVKSALKRMEKAGFPMTKGHHQFYFIGERDTISFSWNGKYDMESSANLFHIRSNADKSDSMTDYFAGYFVKNCKQLIETMKRNQEEMAMA